MCIGKNSIYRVQCYLSFQAYTGVLECILRDRGTTVVTQYFGVQIMFQGSENASPCLRRSLKNLRDRNTVNKETEVGTGGVWG